MAAPGQRLEIPEANGDQNVQVVARGAGKPGQLFVGWRLDENRTDQESVLPEFWPDTADEDANTRRRCGSLRLGGFRYVPDPDNFVAVPYGGRGARFHPFDFRGGPDFTFALAGSFDRDHCVGQVKPLLR